MTAIELDMSATLKNMGGKVWGLSADANNLSLESFDQDLDQDLFEHKDEQGEVKSLVGYNTKHTFNMTGATTGTIALTLLGSATFANEVANLGGATGGTTMVKKIGLKRANEDVQKANIEAFRYPTLTVA